MDQVEGLKALVRVFPLWSAGIMMSINISQGSFQLLQAKSMDRHITSSFQYPAGSFSMFTIIGAVIWIVLYDRILLPIASKILRKPVKIGLKTRMGLGLFCSFLAMVVSAIVEHVRRNEADVEWLFGQPRGSGGYVSYVARSTAFLERNGRSAQFGWTNRVFLL